MTSTPHRPGPSNASAVTESWWKFLIAGPVLILGVIIAAGLGVNAWFLGMAVTFAGVGALALGIVLGLINLSSSRERAT